MYLELFSLSNLLNLFNLSEIVRLSDKTQKKDNHKAKTIRTVVEDVKRIKAKILL